MYKKLIAIAGLLGGTVLISDRAMAAADWGSCVSDQGVYNFSAVLEKTITDTSMNTSGMVFNDFWSWDLGGSYRATCECPAGSETTSVWYSGTSPLAYGHSEGEQDFFVINNNIQISAAIWIEGIQKEYFNVPFKDADNKTNSRVGCDVDGTTGKFGTGSKGKLSLFINRPFVGEMVIPNIKIVDLFGSKKEGVYSAAPLASVFFSGHIIVPQGCELSSGSTLEIPFGEFKASDFKDRKGQIARNATKYTKELQFKCTNISDGVKIFLHIEGMPNANDTNAIDMGNPDIGAVIEGGNGKILVPNDSSINQELNESALVDETHRVASTTISAYPISTTGKLPAAGEFEGIATMRIDVE